MEGDQETQSQVHSKQATRLRDFYANKTIFITGVTGFIGKVFLAKLIVSLNNFSKVFVLMRSKNDATPRQRLARMFAEDPFKTILKNNVNYQDKVLNKIVAVEGDMQLENLGLDDEILDEILSQTDLLFNIAASVSFDAPIKSNFRDNYIGSKNLMGLAAKIHNLQSLVHVSTFFTNNHLSHIEEKVLPLNEDDEQLAQVIDWMPAELADSEAGMKALLENRPNTYVLTKAMSENFVNKFAGKIPIAIVRPSIVTPSVNFPYGGWVDSINGPMGLGALASVGIVRYVDWNYWGAADIVPVDSCANLMLAVAERTVRLNEQNKIRVYNLSTTSITPQSWGSVFEKLRAESMLAPPLKMLRIPIKPPKITRANKFTLWLSKISELLFAYFVDLILILCGQKAVLGRITAKLHKGYEILVPFMVNSYTSNVDNFIAAHQELHPDDKETFGFDLTKVDWDKYYSDAYKGTRKRILREDPSTIPTAMTKMRILYFIELMYKIIFISLAAYFSYKLLVV